MVGWVDAGMDREICLSHIGQKEKVCPGGLESEVLAPIEPLVDFEQVTRSPSVACFLFCKVRGLEFVIWCLFLP